MIFTFEQGVGGFGGGLSEYVTVEQYQTHVLPEHLSCEYRMRHTFLRYSDFVIAVEAGALIEPLAVAWYAIKRRVNCIHISNVFQRSTSGATSSE